MKTTRMLPLACGAAAISLAFVSCRGDRAEEGLEPPETSAERVDVPATTMEPGAAAGPAADTPSGSSSPDQGATPGTPAPYLGSPGVDLPPDSPSPVEDEAPSGTGDDF